MKTSSKLAKAMAQIVNIVRLVLRHMLRQAILASIDNLLPPGFAQACQRKQAVGQIGFEGQG